MIDDPEVPPTGVIPAGATEACWRVWAPRAERVELVLGLGPAATRHPMGAEGRGFHAATTPRPEPGARYAYALDGGDPLPDPRSRRQPDGVHAPSAVHFPDETPWDEGTWRGIDRANLAVYELHVGAFTPEGTFAAIIPRLADLADLGITAVELMPVASFPGSWGWGYDGVFPFAVQETHGGPEGLRRLVEACHRAGLAVILDVVYNHFGPEGNVLPHFGPYLTEKYRTDWGPALNFDDRDCEAVRAFVLDNVRMWIEEYRCDGLRLDAADQVFDRGPRHILADVAEVASRAGDGIGREIHVFAETDLNDAPRFLRPVARGGYGLGGHWTDDFHHAVHSTLTGEHDGYYADFQDGPACLAKAYSSIFVNNGNYSEFRGRRHGTSADEFSGDRFIAFAQNHDQVGNRARSDRNAASLPPAALRLAAGILLLAPRLPLLFMGEEYGETNPFPFFADYSDPHLVEAVQVGRRNEFKAFGWKEKPADPFAPATRDSAVLSWSWVDPRRSGLRRLYRDLFRLRRESPDFRDFRHPRTRLLGDSSPHRVLEVLRESKANRPLALYFNLGPDPRDLPPGLVAGPPSFRSEVAEYGAEVGGDPGPNRLAPWEFLIFGPPG